MPPTVFHFIKYRGVRIQFLASTNFRMRNRILIFSIFATICAAGAAFAQTMQSPNVSASPPASSTQKYTCVMHPEVVMDHPGKCPKCGMTLVPMKNETKPKSKEHASHETHDANGMEMPMGDRDQEHEHEMKDAIVDRRGRADEP